MNSIDSLNYKTLVDKYKYLVGLLLEEEEDFEIIKVALKSIIDPENAQADNMSRALKDRINKIKEIIESPGLYGDKTTSYADCKAIILTKVINKIQEIQNLTCQDKIKYIEDQKTDKDLKGLAVNMENGSRVEGAGMNHINCVFRGMKTYFPPS
jgi:hypothetical protein